MKKEQQKIKNDPLYEEVMKLLPTNKNSLILEAGCGTGKWLLYFKQRGYKNSVGLDFSEVALRKIKENDRTVLLIKADIRKLPIKNNTFDLIFSFGVIEHFKQPQTLVDEMYRVLKKNGRIFLTTPNLFALHTFYRFYRRLRGTWVIGYEDSYTPLQLAKILKQSKFKILRRGTRGKYNRFDIFGFLSFVVGEK